MNQNVKRSVFANYIDILILFICVIFPSNIYASEQYLDDELYRDSIPINLADICLKYAKISDDSNSEEVERRLLDIFKKKYGDNYYNTLSKSMEDAKVIYSNLLDQETGCKLAIIKTKEIYNRLGLNDDNYTNALKVINDMSNTLEAKNKNNYKVCTSNDNFALSNNEHNMLLPFLIDNKNYNDVNMLHKFLLDMVEKNHGKNVYDKIVKEQNEWKHFKRDKKAILYVDTMPLDQAYTKVLQERTDELFSLIAKEPQLGGYEGGKGKFKIYKDNETYYINGYIYVSSHGLNDRKTIRHTFKCKIYKDGMWYKLQSGDNDTFYILFTNKGALVEHAGTGDKYNYRFYCRGNFYTYYSEEMIKLLNLSYIFDSINN